MAINQQTMQLFALSDGMNKFNELMDNSLKVAIHTDVVVDKLFEMVDRIFQVVACSDTVDTAGAGSLTHKMVMQSHPHLIKLRDSYAIMHSLKSIMICCSTTRSTILLR
jgi:hypothetical protein